MRPRLARARRTTRALLLAAALTLAGVRSADATWSIIIVDTRTGEIAIGSATCLSGFDLQLNASIVVPGIGAAAAQSFVDQSGLNRVFLHDQMLRGTTPDDIITRLAGFDSGHQTRQYGIVDLRNNGRATTFTGTGAGQYRGGRTGRVVGGGPTGGDLVYAVQGNVLTGAPVIDAAVAAIHNAPGDVPEKLMRAMEEAMRLGGDGRCSCSQGNPTGCGAPPDEFTRSAYIAYMVVSRDGDRPGCNGLYRLNATGPAAVVAADITRDGAPDLVTCNTASSSVSVIVNTIGSGWATYGLPMLYPVGSSPRDLVSADFDGDGFPDIATANFTPSTVTILRSTAGGTLVGRVDVPAGAGPVALAAADLDGDGDTDLAVANMTGLAVTVLTNDGAGVFTNARTIPVPTNAQAIAAGDLDGDADIDLVAVVSTSPNSSLVILRNTTPEGGLVDFTAETPILAGRGVNAVAIAELNRDTMADLATLAATDTQVGVLLQTKAGFAAPVNYAFAAQGSGLAVGDVNGDGRADIVAASRANPQRFATFEATAEGGFASARFFNLGFTPSKFALADLNHDGTLDFAGGLFNNGNAITVRNFGGGLFNSGAGCASGDYWLDLNVANVPANAPDPVPILRSQLNTHLADQVGQTDAIRSAVVFDPAGIRADGASTTELTITLRDWMGNAVASNPGRTVEIVGVAGAELGTTIGPVSADGDGVYHATVTSGATMGTARFRVHVQDGPASRTITLMPESSLVLLHPADWDLSGAVNSADFFAFLGEFLNGEGDFNHDGVSNTDDFFDFLQAFFTA